MIALTPPTEAKLKVQVIPFNAGLDDALAQLRLDGPVYCDRATWTQVEFRAYGANDSSLWALLETVWPVCVIVEPVQ